MLSHHHRPAGEPDFNAGMTFRDMSQPDKLALHFLARTAGNMAEASG
ncbi:hypothetical protein [Rhodoferax sp. OV413]|nr:hypothetical protein [Rhodoferax sp. OV413]